MVDRAVDRFVAPAVMDEEPVSRLRCVVVIAMNTGETLVKFLCATLNASMELVIVLTLVLATQGTQVASVMNPFVNLPVNMAGLVRGRILVIAHVDNTRVLTVISLFAIHYVCMVELAQTPESVSAQLLTLEETVEPLFAIHHVKMVEHVYPPMCVPVMKLTLVCNVKRLCVLTILHVSLDDVLTPSIVSAIQDLLVRTDFNAVEQ